MKSKKILSLLLALMMMLSVVPFYASAAISLSMSNIEVIPPTLSTYEINYGEPLSTITLSGGQLWYIDSSTGEKTEVAGHFEWRSPNVVPTSTGEYTGINLLFYPEDTTTYGTVSSALRNRTPVVTGYSWPVLNVTGIDTEVIEAPTFECYAGALVFQVTNFTATGGKVIDKDGNDITSNGRWYVKDANMQTTYYEDTEITVEWRDGSKSGYENCETSVMAKVTKHTAELTTAPTIPAVDPGTTLKAAVDQMSGAYVRYTTENRVDTANTYWTVVYPDGYTDDTVLTDDIIVTANYNNPAVEQTFSCQVVIDVLKAPAAVITEMPEINTEGIYAGMKVSNLAITGGVADVAGNFSFTDPEQVLVAGSNTVGITFTPDDLTKNDCAYSTISFSLKGIIKFLDENGNEIIPEIELGYNNKQLQYNLDEIEDLLAPYANCDKFWANFYDLDNNEMEHSDDPLEIGTTKEYTIKGASYNSNYTPAILKFKLTVVPRKLSATVTYSDNTIKVKTTKPLTQAIYGTFEYYANGELIGTSAITGTNDSTGLDWKPEKSGSYDITVKYVAAENDKYYWDDTVLEDMEIICSWGVSVENGSVKVSNSYKEFGSFKYGEDVSVLSGSAASFSHWIVTDVNGNEIDVEGFDKTASGNTFKMPDMSLRFKAVELEIRNITLKNAFVKNAVGTADAPEKYRGQSVNIALDTDALSADDFKGWVITDAQGNEFLPEGLTEADLMNTEITFIMPDFDITVRAKTIADDCDHLCHKDGFLGFIWKIVTFLQRLFGVQQYCDCGNLHYDAPYIDLGL